MTKVYIPKVGERVRVTAVSPSDPFPEAKVGDVLVSDDSACPAATPGFVFVRERGRDHGTWCRVEPVVEASVPAVLTSYGYVEPVTRASFIEAAADEYPLASAGSLVFAWDELHANANVGGGGLLSPREIDEDPNPAPSLPGRRHGQPSPYSEAT